MFRVSSLIGAVFAICVMLTVSHAHAECTKKAGEGTAGTKAGAMFQAYEIILQTTDFFGVWAPWISSGGKIGEAPGYVVKNRKSRCRKGGLGYICVYQAQLCKM